MDYFKLNDGLDEPVVESPKQKKHKPYSPPPRAGPSATRQAARKRKSCQDNDKEMKLPDLVTNTKTSDALNGGSLLNPQRQSTHTPSLGQLNAPAVAYARTEEIISNNLPKPNLSSEPEKTTIQPSIELLGQDICTTTNEEDAIEALLSLGKLPDTGNTVDVQDDNEQLMLIGKANAVVDINPVEIKLGTDDVVKAIAEIP